MRRAASSRGLVIVSAVLLTFESVLNASPAWANPAAAQRDSSDLQPEPPTVQLPSVMFPPAGHDVATFSPSSSSLTRPIAASAFHSYAVKTDGTVWTWGDSCVGQPGDGTNTGNLCNPPRPNPAQTASFGAAVSVASAFDHALALRSDGTVWTWGDDQYGTVGAGGAGDTTCGDRPCVLTPVQAQTTGTFTAVAGATENSYVLRSDGTVWSWGDNNHGELGIGTGTGPETCWNLNIPQDCSTTPVQVSGLTGVTAVSGGNAFGMALKSDGTVWVWGEYTYGPGPYGLAPVQVPGLSNIVAIAGTNPLNSGSTAVALRADGTVWTWGHNNAGELGNGTTGDSSTPVQVSNLSGVTAIAAGETHVLALKSDGTVWAWGSNGSGELGNGDRRLRNQLAPVQVSNLSGVVAIAGGGLHSLAVKSGGVVWAWGDNRYGQLGDGTTTNSNVPVQSQMTGVAAPAPFMVLPTESVPPETAFNHGVNTGETADPVNSFTGSLAYGHHELAMGGRGPAIDITRNYNSNDSRVGPYGPGWTYNYGSRLVLADDGSGDVWLIGPEGRSDRYAKQGDGSYLAPVGVHRILVRSPDGSFSATDKDLSVWRFDSGGRLSALVDRYGNSSSLTYDSASQLISVSDPAGRGSLTLAWTSGRLTSITDWASPARTITYQYDANGRLWKVTDREGKTTTFAYDGASSRLASITDARNHAALTMTYDAQGRVATQRDAHDLITGDSTTFAYVVNGDGTRVTTVTAPTTSFESSFHPTTVDSYAANGWLTGRVTQPSSTETLTESYTYDAGGNRSSLTDARGNRTDFCYDVDYAGQTIAGSAGNLTRTIAPPPVNGANRPTTLLRYDSHNNLIERVAPRGVPSGTTVTCATDLSATNAPFASNYAYDAAGIDLLSTTTRFTDPDAGLLTAVTSFEYGDAANPGRITRIVPPRGNTGGSPDYTYAITQIWNASGTQAGLLASRTDAIGNKTTYSYDAVGRLVSSVDPLGNTTGAVPSDHRTDYIYDNEDRLRFVKQPPPVASGAQLVTETRYDEVGNPIVRIDATGQVSTYAYDERDALSQVKESASAWTDPASPPAAVITTAYAHDAGGNITRMTRAAGDVNAERATDYTFDGRNLVRSETQYPAWPVTTGSLVTATTYDPDGNVATVLDPLGRTTTNSYDALNRLVSVDYSDAGTPDVAFAYDADGNRTSMTDGTGVTNYVRDEPGRMTSVTSPGPSTVGYRYDRDGNRTKVIYPDATAVTYTFNKADRLASLADWASRSVGYTYAADGQMQTASYPDASVATYAYDNAGRLVDLSAIRSGGTVIDRYHYTYDALGNVLTRANGTLDAQFTRANGLTGSNGSWTGTYASINEVTPNDASFLASPAGPTTANYYEVSLAGVQPPATTTGLTFRYRYSKSGNNSGQITNLTVELRQGTTVIASQAQTNIPGASGSGWQQASLTLTATQAASITNYGDLRLRFRPSTTGGGAARSAQVSWAEFQVPAPGDPATLVTYGYDRLSRLTSAQDSGGTRAYGYDPVGNRTSSGTTTYTYDRSDRMTSAGAAAVTVNANGNLTARGADTFAFNQANRLTSATISGAPETYSYDGDGNRATRQIGGNPAIQYVTDPSGRLPLTIADGTRKYVYGQGLAYVVTGSSIEIVHPDRLGSIRAITDGTGAVTATAAYDEWGNLTGSTGSSTEPFGFAGEAHDATGLSYLRARYYNPALGRFMSRDPLLGNPRSCQTLDRYAYVLNDPTTLRDPSGLKSQALGGADDLRCAGAAGAAALGISALGPIDMAVIEINVAAAGVPPLELLVVIAFDVPLLVANGILIAIPLIVCS
jgi:RHS repeat-associated protein